VLHSEIENNFMTTDHTQLVEAARNGNADDVRRFIPLCDPKYNHSECVRLLVPVSRPKNDKSGVVRMCVQMQHSECLELLLPFFDANCRGGMALCDAAQAGYIHGVRRLIPLTDLEARTRALAAVARMGEQYCAELLYPVSEPLEALRQIQELYPQDPQR